MTGKRGLRVLAHLGLAAAFMAPGVASAQTCKGVFIRDSQSYDNGDTPGTVVKMPVVVPKGTRDTIVGYVVIGGRKYYVQYRAYFHDPSDIRLTPGCVLGKYDN
ncbi:MAG: hypothetical protein ACHP84_10985 [Caulobacterales bacterium]